MNFFDIRFLFTRDKMIQRLKNAQPLPTVVMDEVFGNRPQLPSATVPVEDISHIVRTAPFIQRGGASIGMASGGSSISGYEPLSISINTSISAADINILRQYDGQGLEAWANTKTETLRRIIRNTSEGVAAQALNGKVEWPIQLTGGGTDTYKVEWGDALFVTAPKMFDEATVTIMDVVKLLTAMRKAMRKKGFGSGKVKVWAGENAYNAILSLAEKYSGSQLKIEFKEDTVVVAGYEIVMRSEEYPHPTQKDTWVPVQKTDYIRMIDPNGGHQMPYCALDDLDAKLAPLPMFIKPIKQDDPSGYKLVAMSKPFPVPNMSAICECKVL